MRLKIFVPLTISAFLTLFTLLALAQQDTQDEGDDVRGVFMSTRPSGSGSTSSSSSTARPTRRVIRRRRPAVIGSNTNSNTGQSATASNSTNSNHNDSSATNSDDNGTGNGDETVTLDPNTIGLGYTLFMRDANGDAVRIDPQREFTKGESIRLSFEPNTDGYLYIFYQENDKQPQMIFPDVRLNNGNNKISAHVPYEVPSSANADPRYRWFTFDANPAIEHLLVVVTRQPLPNVPVGDDLVSYCNAKKGPCPWQLTSAVWAQVKKNAGDTSVIVSKAKDAGKRQTEREQVATTRGLGLSDESPPPSVIRMNASSNTGLLVTEVDLVHK
jgi:hypothetical protein